MQAFERNKVRIRYGGRMMRANNYQQLAARTINKRLDNNGVLKHGVFGLCSEAGEVAGILQKVYQGHPFDTGHLKKELGDCLWMIAEICTATGFKLEDVMRLNIEKLKARYPEGFTADNSLHRQEGDI